MEDYELLGLNLIIARDFLGNKDIAICDVPNYCSNPESLQLVKNELIEQRVEYTIKFVITYDAYLQIVDMGHYVEVARDFCAKASTEGEALCIAVKNMIQLKTQI